MKKLFCLICLLWVAIVYADVEGVSSPVVEGVSNPTVEGVAHPTGGYTTITLDTSDSTSGTTEPITLSSFSLGQASGTNRIVLVLISHENSPVRTTQSVTFDGDAMTDLGEYTETSGGINKNEIFYMLDTNLPSSSGSYDVVVDLDGGINEVHVHVVSLYGAAQQAPATIVGSDEDPSDNVSTSDTTSENASWGIAIGASGEGATGGFTIEDGNSVELQEIGATGTDQIGTFTYYQNVASAGSFTMQISSVESYMNRMLQAMTYVEPGS